MQINEPFLQQYYYHTGCRYFYEVGGRWSSKTFSVLQMNVLEALNNPGLVIAGARKVYDTIKDSLYADFLLVMELERLVEGVHYKTKVSPLSIEFLNGGADKKNSKVIFKGLDKPDKAKGLSGVHRLIIEECNEFQELDFETLDMSVRGQGYPLITYLMHNPVPVIPGEVYWFQKRFDPGNLKPGIPRKFFSEGLGAYVTSLKSTYMHNAFTPSPIKRRLEGYKHTNPALYKMWALGNYTEVQGVIFTNHRVVAKVPSEAEFLGYGQDFGFTIDPAALLKIYKMGHDKIVLEGKIYKTDLTNKDLIKEYKKVKVQDDDKIVADSAEPKSIEEIREAGFRGIRGVKKRPNYKADTINVLKGFEILIVEGDIDLQREISTYAWQQDKTGKPLPKPQDGNDHYMDCLTMFWYDYKNSSGIMSVPDEGL